MLKLTDSEVNQALQKLPGWRLVDDQLLKMFVKDDFDGAISFVNDIAGLARTLDHHPDIEVKYRTVLVTLSTHDVWGISDLDIKLAQQIEALEEK